MKFRLFHNMMKKPIKKLSRRHFTLLEILVCFVIIGMISGLIVNWGSSLVQHYRFVHSVQGLSSRLTLCKQVSTCYETDVVVVITDMGKNKIELSCMTLGKIYPLQGFLYKKKTYHGIKQILINGEKVRNALIKFFPSTCFPEKITLCSEKNKEINIDIANLLISSS